MRLKLKYFIRLICKMSENNESMLITAAYDACLEKLNKSLKNEGIEVNPQTITTIIKLAMEIVEASKLKGEAQAQLVTKVVRKVVVDAPITDDAEQLLLGMADAGVVTNVISLVVAATKGQLNINVAKEVATNCCLAFLKSR